MQFLIKFIQLLLQDSNTSKSVVKSKINYAFGDNLSNQQAINVFEGYAETPESLIEYLKNRNTVKNRRKKHSRTWRRKRKANARRHAVPPRYMPL
jgi:hypothetical protein